MTFEELFSVYRKYIEHADRKICDGADKAACAKEKQTAFSMFEDLRVLCEDDPARYAKTYGIGSNGKLPFVDENGNEFQVIGTIHYRGAEYAIYDDDAGQQEFIVINDLIVPVCGLGGDFDWWYIVDELVDGIYVF